MGPADGVLHGGSKGIGFVDGHPTSFECNALWSDTEICDPWVNSTSGDGTYGSPSNCLDNQGPRQLRCLFLDDVSFCDGALGRGSNWSLPTGFRSDRRFCGRGDEGSTGVIGERVHRGSGVKVLSGLCGKDTSGACGGEEEGLGSVARSVWIEGVMASAPQRCTLYSHFRYVAVGFLSLFDKFRCTDFRFFQVRGRSALP